MTEKEAAQVPAAHLAYLGDAVMEVLVRRYLVQHPDGTGEHPGQRALAYVTASAQSDAVERILPLLTEAESDEYRRGRNCVHGNVPRASTPAEYRRATGLECLFGYLSLTGQDRRAEELFRRGYGLGGDEKTKETEEN